VDQNGDSTVAEPRSSRFAEPAARDAFPMVSLLASMPVQGGFLGSLLHGDDQPSTRFPSCSAPTAESWKITVIFPDTAEFVPGVNGVLVRTGQTMLARA